MKKLLVFTATLLTIIGLIIYLGLYYITPPFLVKSDIQIFINSQTKKHYSIKNIDINYSPDLFHQASGYSITLIDPNNQKMETIHIHKSKVSNHWTTYRGSSIKNIKPYKNYNPKYSKNTTTERIDSYEK